jgi:hypothetical protein
LDVMDVSIPENSRCADVTPGVVCTSVGGGTRIFVTWSSAARGMAALVFTGSTASPTRR